MKRILGITFAVLCLALTQFSLTMAAEAFPSKPVELWIGYGAGGSTDLPARALADAASKILGKPVVAINKAGGGSSVMMSELKVAKPDGYTLGILSTGGSSVRS